MPIGGSAQPADMFSALERAIERAQGEDILEWVPVTPASGGGRDYFSEPGLPHVWLSVTAGNAISGLLDDADYDNVIAVNADPTLNQVQFRLKVHGAVHPIVPVARDIDSFEQRTFEQMFQALRYVSNLLQGANVEYERPGPSGGDAALHIAVESLIYRIAHLLQLNEALEQDLARVYGDLDVARARISQLEWINECLQAELARTKGKPSRPILKWFAAIALAILSGGVEAGTQHLLDGGDNSQPFTITYNLEEEANYVIDASQTVIRECEPGAR